MKLTLKIWRQASAQSSGRFVAYQLADVSPDMSFLETIDLLNQNLIIADEDPIAFDHDCREGICGSCAMYINGRPHGAKTASTTCQLYMRSYRDGDTITVEPWRANAFPIIKDLMVDRSAFDRIIQSGGYISVNTGNAVDANATPIAKDIAAAAFADAMCIGCGACVAACKNSSAMLFVAAKVSHLSLLPQGQPERQRRALNMVTQMDKEGFGSCSNTGSCSAVCPKEISLATIAHLNREYRQARS
ncbi:succinate dehydrogenase/fumarate reductase iron-sulfur subunit [Chamaesiphon minutus]|uniref:Succinate dehydrogenase and fumarate reductase iron-sulfur protein n=1 Tax=Chamaesiphon minutus (strain ATCC 27169 / PCC 6605) TaxID=1173020 RepID=K9UN06_CHAP6|nr:succinate dehydrogenase/fumarate reductase iron-sulfur subunit [Chamaesiphon minutus]AFY95584.1 succinate dehydrogenase and fumarate reductase iron-sulfur protein [Chamaesiphon minutus PCC 6605]